MEDDDEFGDLYTDVLTSFAPSSSAAQPPPPSQSTSTALNLNRPIDLNAQSSDDEEIIFGASISEKTDFSSSRNHQLTLGFDAGKQDEQATTTAPIAAASSGSHRNLNLEVDKAEDLAESGNTLGVSDRFLDSGGQVKVQARGFEDPNFVDESAIDIVLDERDDKGVVFVDKDEVVVGTTENLDNFDIEEVNTGIGDVVSEHMIPGLSIPGVSDPANNRGGAADFLMGGEGSGEGDDWDSDSEDDLQIVLNNDHGLMAMDRMGGADDDDEDEDGEPLVIVGDSDPNLQGMEDQDWGEDGAQGADGERKDLSDAAKVNGGVAQPPKLPYSNHMYHPFHSQFKYVRPGAAPIPGAAPVGPAGSPGQPRPPISVGPIAGRGRGDWRPPMQKNFHPGFGVPGWGNNGSGRGFGGGLEFTLPSHKTIFEVDIDSFEEKPWKLPGVEISDFFNFGMNEETWKDYCKQLEQLRLEATMQSRIRVYESGRTEQEYDPDMPPELAAAAGIHDVSSENANIAKADAGGQSDVVKDSRARPQLPTGRAIQVETGYGERLPSIDTRAPRMRDSDAIIEIVLQDSADDDTTPVNDTTVAVAPDNNDPSRLNNLSGGPEIEEDAAEEGSEEHFDNIPQAYNNDRKREFLGRRPPLKNSIRGNLPDGDHISPFLPEVAPQYRPDSRGQNSVYPGSNSSFPHDERRTKGRTRDRSPNVGPTTQDKRFVDNHREDSVESVDTKNRPRLSSSPRTVKTTATLRHFDDKESMRDDVGLADGSPGAEREGTAFDTATTTDSIKDENRRRSSKKQRLGSHAEQETDDGEDSKAARSSENSKARSGSSREYRSLRDGSADEVIQDGRSTRVKRSTIDDEHSFRNKGRDERHRMAPKGREEDPYYRKSSRDANPTHHSHMKGDSLGRRKESDNNSDVVWQRKDEDPHGRRARAEDTRKREVVDETGSRHRSKVRENDGCKDTGSRHVDNGSWRGYYDKETGSRHVDREDSVKIRTDNMDDLHGRKRKEEAQRRDHAEKDEILHAHRESTSRRKRERDDVLDQLPSKKETLDQRKRTDDQRSVRHKEEGWFQRERVVDRQREREESLYKREREEVRGNVRSGRSTEEKEWVNSHSSRAKDEYKGSDREYHYKDTSRHGEQVKRRDRVESESVYAHGNQPVNEERRSRQERESTRSDRAANASDNHRVHEKKHKENARKSKESEGDHNSSAASRRNHEDHGSERARLRGTVNEPRKHKEDASSDEEQQDSRRGRSKLERWTSHKERDFTLTTKPSSSSLNVKEIDGYKTSGPSLNKVPQESLRTVEPIADPDTKMEVDPDIKNSDEKPAEDNNNNNRHLDTVAKLKKRSERFKLPMPSEKEALAIKKMENEPLPSSQTETRVDSEVKHERPPRKRRWTSN